MYHTENPNNVIRYFVKKRGVLLYKWRRVLCVLKVCNVSKSFESSESMIRLEILQDVQFSIEPAETLAIIGRSGSGKSTLLSIIAALDRPDQGEVHVNQVVISKLNEKDAANYRARNMGIIFQNFHLIDHLTAFENVSLPLELMGHPQSKEVAKEALEKVGLSHRETHLPSQLSGGECQRVAIARAIVTKPRLLLADEPTGNLDDATSKMVSELLFGLVKKEGMSMMLVTHSTYLASECDRTLTLQKGILQ